jgi:hypothetical protein
MYKKIITAIVAFPIFGLGAPTSGASAATFKNCTPVRAKYPNGIAKSSSAASKQKAKPKVSASLYKTVIKMDRDKDGTSCEK